MKNLVKKIALPGAILAFAMALFGVSAYAEENFKLWGAHTDKQTYYNTIQNSIDQLAWRIRELKKQKNEVSQKLNEAQTAKGNLERDLQNQFGTSDVNGIREKLSEAQTAKGNLERDLQNQFGTFDVNRIQEKIEEKSRVIQQLESDKQTLTSRISNLEIDKENLRKANESNSTTTTTNHNNEIDAAERDMKNLASHAESVVSHNDHQLEANK